MEQVLDIFGLYTLSALIVQHRGQSDADIVESSRSRRALVCLLLVSWFTRIYSLEDTQPTEIRQRYLKLANGLRSGYEILDVSGCPLLLYSGHDRCWMSVRTRGEALAAGESHENFFLRDGAALLVLTT